MIKIKKRATANTPPTIIDVIIVVVMSNAIGVTSTCAENKWLNKHRTLGWHRKNLNGVVDISTFDSDHADTLPEVPDGNGDCERSRPIKVLLSQEVNFTRQGLQGEKVEKLKSIFKVAGLIIKIIMILLSHSYRFLKWIAKNRFPPVQ